MSVKKSDVDWMAKALNLAKQADLANEVPVGAIVVYQDHIIGSGYNRTITEKDPTAHAEILALREAATALSNYRMLGTTIYVTLEPCMMCFGAIIHARVERLVFGASDPKTGVVGGYINLSAYKWNHNILITSGILAQECGEILQNFFKLKR